MLPTLKYLLPNLKVQQEPDVNYTADYCIHIKKSSISIEQFTQMEVTCLKVSSILHNKLPVQVIVGATV